MMPTTFTIGQANECLAQCGFNVRLGPAAVQRIKSLEPMERVVRALKRGSKGDRGAREWLQNVLRKTGLDPNAGRPPAQAELPLAALTPAENPAGQTAGRIATTLRSYTDGREYGLSVHVYGRKAALCFEADETRGSVATVALDAAKCDANGERRYAWEHKVRIQLTRQELPIVAAVLLGYLPSCEYRNHGRNNDKGFAMENQGQRVFVKVWAKDQGQRAVPIEPGDICHVAGLVLRQLRKQQPWLDGSTLSVILQSVGKRLRARH